MRRRAAAVDPTTRGVSVRLSASDHAALLNRPGLLLINNACHGILGTQSFNTKLSGPIEPHSCNSPVLRDTNAMEVAASDLVH